MRMGKAIDGIIEDSRKEYLGIDNKGFKYTLSYCHNGNRIIMAGGFGTNINDILKNEYLEMEWELVEKPVTFMEVVESMKPFRVEHSILGNNNYGGITQFLDEIVRTLGCEGKKIILTEGKFYIKEEN